MADEKKPYYLRDATEGGGEAPAKSEFFSALLYGKFGTGKTVAAYSWPAPLGISLDKGESTLEKWNIDAPYERFFYRKTLYRELIDILTDARERKGPWFGPDGKYADRRTLVIDTGTELSDFLTYELMKLEAHKDKGGNVIQWAPEDNPPSWDHYALLTSRMEAVGRAIRDLKETQMHVVMTCLEQAEVDKSGNTVAIYPMLTGKTREKIAAWFDEVYVMTKEKEGVAGSKFVAYPYDFGLYKCKSRFGFTAPIKDLTYEKIVSLKEPKKTQTVAGVGGPPAQQN